MSSIVSICNLALLKLGEARLLLLDDDTEPGRVMKALYPDQRDAELRAHRWKFALKRDSLPALAAAPAWGYQYQYPLPSDYLAMVQVNDFYIRSGEKQRPPYSIEAGAILCDYQAPLKVRYISQVTNPGVYDALFVEVLACKLALEACEKLTQSDTKFQRVAAQYKAAISRATMVDAIEKAPDEIPDGSWLDSRETDSVYPGQAGDYPYLSGF